MAELIKPNERQILALEAEIRHQAKARLEERIAQLLKAGISSADVAKRLGLGRSMICVAARRLGVKASRRVENANCNPPEVATAIPYHGQTQAHHPVDWWDA